MASSLVYRTAVASLLVQLVLGAGLAVGIFLPKPDGEERMLDVVLALELTSQAIELVWYAAAVVWVRTIATWARYADWVVSTPIMLLSTFFFLGGRAGASLEDVLSSGGVYAALGLNALMLSCGLAGEWDVWPRARALPVGFVAFGGAFALLFRAADRGDGWSVGLLVPMTAVWAAYGVAAALPYTPKNVAYNLLDVVSKNLYGVFLLVYVLVEG